MQSRFDHDGYVIVPGLIDAGLIESTKRKIAELLAKARQTPEFILGAKGTINLPRLDEELPLIAASLQAESIQALLQAHLGGSYVRRELAYRNPQPGFGAQTIHTDWTGPVPPGQWVVANAFVALCEIDASNGGTRLVPGSHRQVSTFRAKAPSDRHPNEIVPHLSAGEALVFSGHILHSGTKNASSTQRPLLIATFQRDS